MFGIFVFLSFFTFISLREPFSVFFRKIGCVFFHVSHFSHFCFFSAFHVVYLFM